MTQTYLGWDDNEYPWPPPDGWYQAAEGKWWPEGYGPGAPEAATGVAPPMENPGGMAPPPAAAAPPPAASPPPATTPLGGPPPGNGPPPAGGFVPPAAPGVAAPGVEPAPQTMAGPPPASDGGGGGNKMLLILGGLGALILIAGGGIFALTRGGGDEGDSTAVTVEQPDTDNSGDPNTDTSTSEVEPDDTTEATTETETTSGGGGGDAGTFENPHAFGDSVTIFYEDFDGVEKTWVVQILEPAYDGTSDVMDENQFNDPPPDGEAFAIARVKITYESGPAPGSVSELNLKAVGPSAVVLTWFGNYCGVVPDSLETSAELFPGGSTEGNLCFSTAEGDIGAMTMLIDTFAADGEVYLSMQ